MAGITKAEEEILAGQGPQDSNVAEGSLLLSLVIDEELCIVDSFGQGPMLVPKLRQVQPVARTSRAFQIVWLSESRASSGVLAEVRD